MGQVVRREIQHLYCQAQVELVCYIYRKKIFCMHLWVRLWLLEKLICSYFCKTLVFATEFDFIWSRLLIRSHCCRQYLEELALLQQQPSPQHWYCFYIPHIYFSESQAPTMTRHPRMSATIGYTSSKSNTDDLHLYLSSPLPITNHGRKTQYNP